MMIHYHQQIYFISLASPLPGLLRDHMYTTQGEEQVHKIGVACSEVWNHPPPDHAPFRIVGHHLGRVQVEKLHGEEVVHIQRVVIY
jgi:hypothetical protein